MVNTKKMHCKIQDYVIILILTKVSRNTDYIFIQAKVI